MKRLLAAIVAAGACAVAGQAYAHHSFPEIYLEDRTITIEGELAQIVLRNPHSFVHLEAPDANGVPQRWAVEWGGTAQLAGAGVKRDSLKVGDAVVLTVNPSRAPGEYRVLMLTLKRPVDGFAWGRRADQTE